MSQIKKIFFLLFFVIFFVSQYGLCFALEPIRSISIVEIAGGLNVALFFPYLAGSIFILIYLYAKYFYLKYKKENIDVNKTSVALKKANFILKAIVVFVFLSLIWSLLYGAYAVNGPLDNGYLKIDSPILIFYSWLLFSPIILFVSLVVFFYGRYFYLKKKQPEKESNARKLWLANWMTISAIVGAGSFLIIGTVIMLVDVY